MWQETDKSKAIGAKIETDPGIVSAIPHNGGEKFPIRAQYYYSGGELPVDGTIIICNKDPKTCGAAVGGGRLGLSCGADLITKNGYVFRTLERHAKRPICGQDPRAATIFEQHMYFIRTDEIIMP